MRKSLLLTKVFSRSAFFIAFAFFLLLAVAEGEPVNPRETPVVKVVQDNAEAVVNISTEHIVLLRENPVWGDYGSEFDFWFDQFFGMRQPTRALKLKSVGSGVIVDKAGIVVTNAHVVHMASSVFVILNDGTSLKGQVMYENPQDDLAIIKVHALKPLKEVALGKSGDIMVGETAVVIGNPLGLENSVSVGIISGIGREIYSSRGEKISDELIQTDAPINPGNSGGALLSLNGELLGINVAVVQNSQSIGFAVPVQKVRDALEAHRRNQDFAIKTRRREVSSGAQGGGAAPAPSPRQEPRRQWDPFLEMERIREEMDAMFRDAFGRQSPQRGFGMFNTDISYDTDFKLEEIPDGYAIKLDISGLDKDKIDVEINEHTITISGEGSGTQEEYGPQSSYKARSFHSFLRTIPLPEDANSRTITTDKQGDTLIIQMKKVK
jgi:S1-C subfamily serine protease/HSP20 family molecular chaperone IbpA